MPEAVITIPPIFKAIDPVYIDDDGTEILNEQFIDLGITDKERQDRLRKKQKYDYFTIKGGRGGGKSESVGRKLLVGGIEEKRKIVCGREIQSSIKESVYDMLGDFISTYGFMHNGRPFYNVLKTEIRAINGTAITFAGLRHNINSIKSMYDVDDFWGEEAQVFSYNTLSILLPTIRKDGSRLYFTMNPELEDDPSYQTLVVVPPPKTLVLTCNYPDNPYFPDRLRHLMEKDEREHPERHRHIWLGHCKASVEGAIYAEYLQRATDQKRIGDFPYDDRYPVSAFVDIGWNDNTSIWFLQFVDHKPRVIASYQNQFQKTPHYVDVFEKTKYRFDRIVLPHDANNEHANADRTWLQIFKASFPNANVSAGKRQAVELRLEATKNMFDLLYFNKEGTIDGRSALGHYHFAVNPETGRQTKEPFHGEESNYADAFGYMCLELKTPSAPKKQKKKSSIYSGLHSG